MRAELNVTPLVDVVLVLLIIFMVLSPLQKNGYDAKLPKTKSTPTHAAFHIEIVQTSEKAFFVNQRRVELSQFETHLQRLLKSSGQKKVFYKADDDLRYGNAVKTMDVIHTLGAEIGVITSEVNHD